MLHTEACFCGIFGHLRLLLQMLPNWIAKLITITGNSCGLRRTRSSAANCMAEDVSNNPMLSTKWFMCQWCNLLTITTCLCQYLPLRTSFIRTTTSTCLQRSFMSTKSTTLLTIAMKATLTGTLDGLHTRSLGAVTTEAWDAQEPGTAATTFTLTFLRPVSAMRKAISMTAVLASPIGCRVGQIPRRTGAAISRAGAAWSSTALLARLLVCFGNRCR